MKIITKKIIFATLLLSGTIHAANTDITDFVKSGPKVSNVSTKLKAAAAMSSSNATTKPAATLVKKPSATFANKPSSVSFDTMTATESEAVKKALAAEIKAKAAKAEKEYLAQRGLARAKPGQIKFIAPPLMKRTELKK